MRVETVSIVDISTSHLGLWLAHAPGVRQGGRTVSDFTYSAFLILASLVGFLFAVFASPPE
jgi:hypothetical protein